MEEAWLAAKCGSRWPPSLPASSPARPLPPPPATLAPLASSLGAANSMGLDSHKFRHPFLQQINIGDSAIVQEPKIFNTLNLDSCKSGKAELGSSFLSLLSGSAHPASSKFLQPPYSGSELAKFHVREGGVVNGPRCDVPVTSISPISESRVIENGEDFPFVASRPLSMSTCTNFPLLQNNFQAATSSCHSTRFGKTVPRQAFPGNNAGTKVSSRKHEWPIASSPSNANQQSISNQTTEKIPSEARPSNRSHSSTTFRGRPHVFCMNKVGELFVSDMGLLGVLCFCHKQPMSVAKFCEHSGFPSANPGEAVHLENGMTVAQWRKLCFGVMASDRSNEWEWSDGSSAEVGLVRPKFSSFPTSSKNSASINSFEAFSGLGKIGEPCNKTIFPNHTYGGLRGQTASEKSANKGTENVLQRNGLDRQNLSTKRFAGSAQSTIPALSKNHMAQAIKESPIRMGFEGSHLTSNQGEQNVVPQLVANNISYVGEIGNHPISFPHSGMNNTFSCANHIHRGNFSGQTFVVDQDGSSSNIELRLGHPSQKNNTSPGSFPVAMHPFHLGSVCNLQKAQLHQPLAHTNAADYPKESKKPRLDLQCTLSEESPLNRRLHHSSGSNVFKHSEIEDPMGDATKSSLISFLSHLNTEGNSSSQSTDIIGNYNEYFGARVFDSASLYAKCNFSDFARDLIDGIEKKPDTNGSDLSNNIDQAKGLNIVDNGSYAVVKPNYVVHRKQPPDARVLSSATGGHCIYNSSSVDNRQPTLYFNQPSGMLQTAPNYRNSDKYAEVSLQGNRDRCSCTIHTSTSPIPNATARHCSHNSENLISFSSINSMHISEPISALSNKKSADRTQNLRDESFISLPLRHMDELSKLELPTSLETNTRCKRLCCLSDVGFLRNVCKDDLVATKELREAPYCIIQQDESSNVVKSTHSFSNCYSCCDVQMSSANADSTGPFKCCNCSASTQRLSCSKEHGIQFSTSHTCHAFEKPCLRLGRISNNSYPDSNKHEVCNHKEESSPISGKCCCTALPKYLTGCCFSGGDSLSGALSEHLCGKAKTMHVSPTYDRDDMLQDGRRVRLGQCECLRKHVGMKNDCQIALWRDVPNKVRGHSDAAANEKSAQVVATRLVGDQLTDTAAKETDGTHQESKSLNEQQMSNVSSGSSAAAITEISIEVNNMVSITTDAGKSKIVCDSMVNEGSRIEKCGSSDEALDNRESEEAINFTDRVKPINSSGNLTNELRLDCSSNFRRPRNQISVGCTDQENISQIHQFDPACRVGKRKGPMKQSKIDASVPTLGFASLYSDSPEHVSHSLHQPPSQELDTSHQSDNIMRKMRVYTGRSPSFKRKRSALSSTKPFYLKRFKKHHKVSECDKVQSIYNDHSHRKQKVSAGKKAKQNLARDGKKQFTKEKEKLGDAGRPPKFMSLSCIGSSLNHGMDTSCKKVRPVVCSNSGIISSGAGDKQKPAKIVSLSLILKKASSCSITEHGGKPRLSCISGNKKTCLDSKIQCHNAISTWKLQCENEDSSVVIRNGMDPSNLVSSKIKKISTKNEKCPYEFSIMKRDADYGYDEALESALHHEIAISGSKPRCKETREDEYLDLTESRNQLKTSPSTDIGDALVGNEHSTMKSCSKKVLNTATSANAKLLVISQNGQDHADEPREVNTRRCQSFISDLDAFCCVCGSSNKEDINQLLECNRCLIRVHQACYGISKVPKGRWCCRPCKTNSLNIVCVLCGYGGGAMTRALKSRNIVRSLLKAWKVGRGLNLINPAPSSNGIKSEISEPGSVGEASEYDGSVHVVESISSETFPADASETDLTKSVTMSHSDSMPNNFQASNSVTVGILDPSVTQWVHMVCGLWTPGTRCPNVDTMSAFDVSGASPARKITVCSMCNRPGGSCIQCRVMNCSVHFHPWCAHQKGLLQSEIEGDDNESVGFYGRCLLHATPSSSHVHSYPVGTEVDSSKNKDWTCARTEDFKGRKRDEGFNPNHHKPYNDGGGCIVSQEQINAWLHINGQKSCTRRAVKLPSSDIEYDVRKEYIRYKQSKAWKQLVVYKSGIHALGLYTSQFISRGAMVVEYVGEIVGLRIADKREIEYQSGRRLQYKSACYFFRIDKEHIIDATRKGGIARFVNHSCLPNCVAKVISVRNEKKVVFFAERDIYPGEEITYDYHFNHEDEGKKIPCFCNSKNCRRYLN